MIEFMSFCSNRKKDVQSRGNMIVDCWISHNRNVF